LEKPERYIGSVENWKKQKTHYQCAKAKGLNFVNRKVVSWLSTVPKLDFNGEGAPWQETGNWVSIQVGLSTYAERFDLTYKGSDNELHKTGNDITGFLLEIMERFHVSIITGNIRGIPLFG